MVFNSLLDNAFKYTEKGKIVVCAKDHDSNSLLVVIQDTGKGIENEKFENLFDPYRREITEGQKYGGIGVGLALAKLYIELQRGKIWVGSIPGYGTSVYFTLPLYK